MSEPQFDESRILKALSGVKDPELGTDIVSLGMIENLKLEPGAS